MAPIPGSPPGGDEQGPRLRPHTRETPQYQGIVVDVNDPGIWMPGLGDLVGIGTGRQACPDVEELADSIVTQEPYRPHQELTVGARWAESPARS